MSLKRLRSLLFAAAVFLLPAASWAQQEIAVRPLPEKPRVDDFLEMRPSEKFGGSMARVADFTQRFPKDGEASSQVTEAYLGYDDTNLYITFLCSDKEPGKIRAGLSRRDEMGSDDMVQVYLDTFGDHRRAYLFEANPYGIQRDGIWTEGQGVDRNFDAVWESESKITPQGYVVLLSIPFRSLRFPPPETGPWGILLARQIPRNAEASYWPYLSRKVEGYLGTAAHMSGLAGIAPGRNIQLIPYGVSRTLQLADQDGSGTKLDAGLDAKLVLRDRFSLDLTWNPDFGEVEGDQPLTVNKRFEAFLPERRPFFTENAGYFKTPINLVHTRRIVEPRGGIRLTGKTGGWTVATLFADDIAPGRNLEEDDPGVNEVAKIGIVRLNKDISRQSTAGLLVTERSFAGDSNRVLSADTRLSNSVWTFTAQAAQSSTESGGVRQDGRMYDLALTRTGDLFYFGTYQRIDPDFHTDLGYVTRTDLQGTTHFASYSFHPKDGKLVSWGPGGGWAKLWNISGEPQGGGVNLQVEFEFPKATYMVFLWNKNTERLTAEEFPGILGSLDLSYNWSAILLDTSRFQKVGFSAFYSVGSDINYVPPDGQAPFLGDIQNARLTLVWRPLRALKVDSTYILNRMERDGRKVFRNEIARCKVSWQLTRELSLRSIIQWDAVEANPALTDLTDGKHLNGDLLLTYQLRPYTAVHVGYNTDLRNPDEALAARPADARGLEETARQFFFKVSYLFRF